MEEEKQDVRELSDIEKSAIGEICDLMTASLAKVFGDTAGSDVAMNPSSVEVGEFAKVSKVCAAPVLLVQLSCTSGLEGQFFLFLAGEGLPKVFDLGIPEDAKEVGAEDEVILENLKEMVDTAISGAMTNFAESMGYTIDCSVIDTIILQDESGFESIGFLYPEGMLLYVVAELTLLGDAISAGYLLPVGVGNQIIELLLNDQLEMGGDTAGGDIPTGVADEEDIDGGADVEEAEGEGGAEDAPALELTAGVDAAAHVTEPPLAALIEEEDASRLEEAPRVRDLQQARFGTLSEGAAESGSGNISLLLDVTLDASIELGKTQMTIEEILKLGRGSVIELDKLASEPVEFLVNGKIIARGEVVVIDDNFGIRITEILSPKARLENL